MQHTVGTRGLIYGLLLGVAAHTYTQVVGQSACRAGPSERRTMRLLEQEGVDVPGASQVLVKRTRQALYIHLLKGEVILKRRRLMILPIVVTAGSAQLRNIDSDVCVGIDGERTGISVLDGAVDMSVLSTGLEIPDANVIPLRGGDRVELTRIPGDVLLHISASAPTTWDDCGAKVLRWAGIGR